MGIIRKSVDYLANYIRIKLTAQKVLIDLANNYLIYVFSRDWNISFMNMQYISTNDNEFNILWTNKMAKAVINSFVWVNKIWQNICGCLDDSLIFWLLTFTNRWMIHNEHTIRAWQPFTLPSVSPAACLFLMNHGSSSFLGIYYFLWGTLFYTRSLNIRS